MNFCRYFSLEHTLIIELLELFQKGFDSLLSYPHPLHTTKILINQFDGGISTDSSVERREKLPVGKLRNPESFLQQQQDTEEETHQKVRVGKLNSDIFKVQSESEEPSKPLLRVGKLNTENLFPKPEDTQPKPQPKVGKISTKESISLKLYKSLNSMI